MSLIHYIFVTGGVISGLGKGTVVSSLGLLLRKAYNYPVTAIKIDPYLNEDAGLMAPGEHGEVFVLEDGGECDLDLGTYERSLNRKLGADNNITSGKILRKLLNDERRGMYLGKTVQVVPHFTRTVQQWIEQCATRDLPDGGFCLVELGGTVGDYESMWFVEAMRQMRARLGSQRLFTVHVALVPRLGPTHEHKTKPLQHSVRALRQYGWSPDAIICRADTVLTKATCMKIAVACDVQAECVVSMQDVDNLYSVPSMLFGAFSKRILAQCTLTPKVLTMQFNTWHTQVAERFEKLRNVDTGMHVALVGKYDHSDAYLSIKKAFEHVVLKLNVSIKLDYINVTTEEGRHKLGDRGVNFSAYIFAGGFDTSGVEYMITLLKRIREKNIPTLGICLGMQLMVIEAARNCAKWPGATSEEFLANAARRDDQKLCIIIMSEHNGNGRRRMGNTMRLGARTSEFITPNSKLQAAYGGVKRVTERHRHRLEVNPLYVSALEKTTPLRMVARDVDTTRLRYEMVEHATNRFYAGVQFHPEFTSSIDQPSPPLMALVQALF